MIALGLSHISIMTLAGGGGGGAITKVIKLGSSCRGVARVPQV